MPSLSAQKSYVWFTLKVLAVIAVFTILIVHMRHEFAHLWIIPIYLILGYFFGKITCGTHTKRYGLWLTLGLFIGLNLIHSLIDGVLVINLSTVYRNLAIYSHELIRQPALYIVIWSMLEPFKNAHHKIIISILSVTGVWIIGMYAGALGGSFIPNVSRFDSYLAMTIFIFAGDIIHHLIDDFRHLRGHTHD